MKRRHFLGSLALGSVGTVISQQPAPVDRPLVRTPLVLMAPRADGIEAAWAVTRLCRGRIEWENDSGGKGWVGSDSFGFVPQGDNVLRVRLDGLSPGTAYRIRSHTIAVDNGEAVISPWKSFRTLNPAASQSRFVMWNDTHIQNDTIRALHAATPAADFLVWNGDTCNDWTSEELLVPTLLHPGECDVTDQRPMLMVWGNHDSRGPYAFRVPEVIATPSGRPFYAFRSGPVGVICLHTGEDKPDDHPSFRGRVAFDALRAEQARWLSEVIHRPDLKDAPYRIVFCHIPLRWKDESPQDYSKDGYDRHSGRSRSAWHQSLVNWKAQVLLSGHTHQSIWMPPTENYPYGQLIGGGPRMASATWTECVADQKEMVIKVHNLEGKILHQVTVGALSQG